MFLGVFVAAVLGAPAAATSANPLAMAEMGQLQCYRPDVQKRTCQSMASYRRTGPSSYDNKAIIPLGTNATLETHTPVVIKGGAVCGYIRGQDQIAGTLRVDGVIVEPQKAKPILERVAQAMATMADKEICTTYEPSGDSLTAKVSIGGIYSRDQDETVKWIGATEGYTVTP